MYKILLGLVLMICGVAAVLCNQRSAIFVYNRTEGLYYSWLSSLISEEKYKKFLSY
jgi:hypothetical protein